MKRVFITISCVVAVFAITAVGVFYNLSNVNGPYSFWGSAGSGSTTYVRVLFLGTVMLAGIIFGHLDSALKLQEEAEPFSLAIFKNALMQKGFWRSLIASPIVFSFVYANIKEQPDIVMAAIFAFQNGFFCDVILERQRKLIISK